MTLVEFDQTSQSPDPFALSTALSQRVRAWSSDDYPPVNGKEITSTTRELLRYWFKQDSPDFYKCQQEAMETIVYCFEILGNPIPKTLYSLLAPEELQKEMGYLKKIAR